MGVASREWFYRVRTDLPDCTVRYHSPLPTPF